MPRLDLALEAEAHRIELADTPPLTRAERALVESTWRGRMANEHASARVFAGLVPQLMRAEIRPAKQAELATFIADELRHAEQCAGVLVSIGARASAELPDLGDIPAHAECEPLEAALRNVLSICCLSETVAVSLINAERIEQSATPIGGVLQAILADEVKHARFGWKLLEDTPLEDAMRARLSDYLRVALAHLELHELAHLSPVPAPNAAMAYGACDGALARDIFYSTVEEVIVPRLEQHGFDAARAWAERSTPSARGAAPSATAADRGSASAP